MRRPKLRKASKRMTCSKKYRIRKNVAAYNKKVKKLAKKGEGKTRHTKKDPGVPNSIPFKEEILHEAEMRKQRAEEEKQRQKEARRNEVNKRRSLESLQENAMKRQKVYEAKVNDSKRITDKPHLGSAKELSRKAYYKEFIKVVESSDVVVEVLDARDPLGCRCLEMEKIVLDSGAKRIILLLNKIDLVPKANVEEWLKYLRNEFPTVAFKASTQSQANLTRHKVPLKRIHQDILSNTSQCVGADSLLKLLSNYSRRNDVETTITVGVVGFPNVGKSSVINSLKRSRACGVGAMPGITKVVQEVNLNKHIKIIDCPGIVMATRNNTSAIILRNCIKVETLDDPISPVAAMLSRCNKEQMMMRYNLGNYNDTNEFLELLARRKGKLRKGGVPNINAAAKCVLQDWNNGKITYYTHPPEKKGGSHINAKIVQSMSTEFDWEKLDAYNLKSLEVVKGNPSQTNSILFQSSGPSAMVTEGNSDKEDAESDKEDAESDKEDAESDEEDAESDEEEMDQSQELGQFTIEMKPKKVNSNKLPDDAMPVSIEGLDDVTTEGRNIQANRDVKRLMKQNKKKRKRADKLSDKLGDSLLSSMNLTSEPADDYDFATDMQL